MTGTARQILEEYVTSGTLMQVASLSDDGHPSMCNVWYHVAFRPDRLYFISRHDRVHSGNIKNDERVAGSIVAIPLTGLGQTVRGVTFIGNAYELNAEARSELDSFLKRWPNAQKAISSDRVARDETFSRLYEIRVSAWVLFDEENFPEAPRQSVSAMPATSV
jgi:uncharacterized protein YhbP (UPF0306 family)